MKTLAALPADRSSSKSQSFVRAAFAKASGGLRSVSGEDILAQRWPSDSAARHLIRGATTAATTTDDAWAGALAADAFGEFLVDLATTSAAAGLIARGQRVTLTGGNTMTFPVRTSPPTAPAWVAESGAIPVIKRPFTNVTLGPPKKLSAIVVWSWEMDRHTKARTVFEQMMREDIAVGLDLAYFSTTAASAAAHAGLLNGVAAIPPSAAGGATAMMADLANLIGAVSGVGSSGETVLAMSRKNAALMPVRLPETSAQLTILSTPVLTDAQVVAVDPKSVAHSTDENPDVFISDQVTLHMEDTAPLPISVPGTPPPPDAFVAAAPVISTFQEAKIALRILHDIGFVKTRANAVAWISAAAWGTP